MTGTTDWRERFLKLSDQYDEQTQSHLAAERELLRLITRLCVACQGLDAMLDPHLTRLRKAARDGAGGKLRAQVQAFGDALIQAQEDRQSGDLASLVLDRSGLNGSQLKKALSLWKKLAAAPTRASEQQLDELASLLFGTGAGGVEPSGSGSLFGRILGRDKNMPPNQVLRDVIAAVSWPQAMQNEISGLEKLLGDNAPQDAWVAVVREISRLAITAFDKVNQDAAAASAFLAQLSERLQAIDHYVAGEGERRKASRQSGHQLGKAVSDEVGGLSAGIDSQGDMSSLRNQVMTVLDRIQGHVARHLDEEMARGIEAEKNAISMQTQLEKLQRETFDLRRQVAETHQAAMTDALTGLPNRRAYEERAAQELARWRRFSEPLVLVVWDVDDFKHINDVFGHKAGDKALALIARILRESLRETDFIARYGGEEFVVLLTGADTDDALRVAEMMRSSVEQAGMHSHNKPVKITLSGGIAQLQGDETIEQLFERADKAMYQAKQFGKNRCVVAD